MPTPICLSLWDTTNETHQGAFIALLIWATKFSGFHNTKTSANKRFLLCLQTDCSDCVAKVVKYFGLSKKNRFLGDFFV